MIKQTKSTRGSEIEREWHLIDVKDKVLGRVSTEIAVLLMGKSKPYFVRNMDCGDYVVVLNAQHVKVTGNKESQKNYYSHSGYPGGFKSKSLSDLRKENPTQIIVESVKGMLPQNRLRDKMLKRLRVFPSSEHKYQDKFKSK